MQPRIGLIIESSCLLLISITMPKCAEATDGHRLGDLVMAFLTLPHRMQIDDRLGIALASRILHPAATPKETAFIGDK